MKKSASSDKEKKRKEMENSATTDGIETPIKKKSHQNSDSVSAICSFPMSRVWRLVRGEWGGISAAETRTTSDAVFIINKASEMFLERLTEDAYDFADREHKKIISYNHISSTINRGKRYEFLSDFAPEKIRAEDALKSRSMIES